MGIPLVVGQIVTSLFAPGDGGQAGIPVGGGGDGPLDEGLLPKILGGLFSGNGKKVNDTQLQEAFSREWLVRVQPRVRIVRGKDPGFVSPEEACELIAVGDRNEAQTLAAFVRSESRAAWHTFPNPGAIWAEWKADLQKRCSERGGAGGGAGLLIGPGADGDTRFTGAPTGPGAGLFASFLPGVPGEFPLVPVVLLGGGFLLMLTLIISLGRK